MAIKMVLIKCPKCGANLEYEEGRKILYCKYCGAKVAIDNDNEYTYNYHTTDDAAVEKAKAERDIKLRNIEREERKEKEQEKSKRRALLLVFCMIAISYIALFIMHDSYSEKEQTSVHNGEIQVNYNYNDLVGQPTDTVVNRLEKLGFTNIETQEEDSLSYKIGKDSGDVTSIWADGSLIESQGYFDRDTLFIVKYKK